MHLKMPRQVRERLGRWILYSVLFSLIPIVADYLHTWSLIDVLRGGQLFLLASGFAAVGLGEIIATGDKYPMLKIFGGGFSIINIGLATFLYADSHSQVIASQQDFYAKVSIGMFIFSVVTATSCVLLGESQNA